MIDSSVFAHTTVYAPRFPKILEAVKSPDVVPFPICITERYPIDASFPFDCRHLDLLSFSPLPVRQCEMSMLKYLKGGGSGDKPNKKQKTVEDKARYRSYETEKRERKFQEKCKVGRDWVVYDDAGNLVELHPKFWSHFYAFFQPHIKHF